MRFYSTLRQHSAIKIFLYNIIFKKSRALHIWSKLLLFLGRRKIQIIFSPQKVFEFFAPNRKKSCNCSYFFLENYYLIFFFKSTYKIFVLLWWPKRKLLLVVYVPHKAPCSKIWKTWKKKYYALNKILRCQQI